MSELPYTICFCFCKDHILLLYRHRPPNQFLWNGLGGKLHAGETPLEGIQREMMEEAELDLRQARELRFAGIVTWIIGHDLTHPSRGMYAFLAHLSSDFPIWLDDRPTPEGLLCWKPVEWVFDPENTTVVSNIPRFLPAMLKQTVPQEYRCYYQDGRLERMDVFPIKASFVY